MKSNTDKLQELVESEALDMKREMIKLWVHVNNSNSYDSKADWKLGTVVGTTTLPHRDDSSLKSALEGEKLRERYLIELDSGEIVEAWYWDTYSPSTVRRELLDTKGVNGDET